MHDHQSVTILCLCLVIFDTHQSGWPLILLRINCNIDDTMSPIMNGTGQNKLTDIKMDPRWILTWTRLSLLHKMLSESTMTVLRPSLNCQTSPKLGPVLNFHIGLWESGKQGPLLFLYHFYLGLKKVECMSNSRDNSYNPFEYSC